MNNFIYIDGKFVSEDKACISATDRGFLLADVIFETMRGYKDQIFSIQDHWERFCINASVLNIKIDFFLNDLIEIASELLKLNGLNNTHSTLRLTLTRGASERGLLPSITSHPTVLLTTFPFKEYPFKSVDVIISNIRKNEFSPLSNVKSLNYLDNVLARIEASKKDCQESLLLNTKSNLSDGSMSNVFIINKDDIIMTPSLEEGALPGITRKHIIELCEKNNLLMKECIISQDDIFYAKEIFLSNALIGIVPVKSVNGVALNNKDKISDKIILLYNDLLHNFFNGL